MSADCCTCCADRSPSPQAACPGCGAAGQAVPAETLQALLVAPPTGLDELSWFFCASPRCDVVYFDHPQTRVLGKESLKVRVGIKETQAPRPLCYCFGHSAESIAAEVRATGRTTAPRQIEEAVRSGACRCSVRNPSGRCCLPTIRRFVAELTEGRQEDEGVAARPPSGPHG